MFAIAKDTTADDILKAQEQTGFCLKSPARKANKSFSASVKCDDAFAFGLFENALMERKAPLLSQALTPEELENYAREYAQEEAASSLAYSLLPA